jgi:hypothetical protein
MIFDDFDLQEDTFVYSFFNAFDLQEDKMYLPVGDFL